MKINKVVRNALIIDLVLIIFVITNIVVYASGEYFNSTISISHNSSLTGSVREYKYPKHKIEIIPTKLEYGYVYTDRTRVEIELMRPLYRLGIRYGEESKGKKNADFYETGTKVTTYFLSGGKGKRYYDFSTWTARGLGGNGLIKGNVVMWSYE